MPVSKEVQYLIDKHGLQGGNFVEARPGYTVSKNPQAKQDFGANVIKSVKGAASAAGNALYGVASGFGKGVGAWGHNLVGEAQMLSKGVQMNIQAMKGKELQDKFKAGKISAKQYSKEYAKLLSENKRTSSEKEAIKKDQLGVKELATASAETAGNVLALAASGGLGQSTLKNLAGKEGAAGVLGKGAQFTGRALGMDTSGSAAGALVKSQLVAKPSVQTLPQIAKDVSTGNYGGAAINTALLASGGLGGGPLGTGEKILSKAGQVGSKAIYDTHGLYDVIKLKGGSTINQAMDELKAVKPAMAKKIESNLKVLQDLAVQEHGTRPEALKIFLEANQPEGKKFADMTLGEFTKAASELLTSRSKFQSIAKKAGLAIPEGKGVVAARITKTEQAAIADRLANAANPVDELAKLKKEGIVKNANLAGQLDDMIKTGATGKDLSKLVGQLKSVTPALIDGKEVRRGGYILGLADNAGTVKRASEVGDIVRGKKAPLGFVGEGLKKVGLSTQESSPELQRALFKKVSDTFKKSVDASEIKISGQDALQKLSNIAKEKLGVTDIRQLRWREVSEALSKEGVTDAESKQLLKLYKQSFSSLSTSERGLGGKLTDINLRYNPIAAPYSRVQSIARYEMNPFFRVQENLETKIGTKMFTGKTATPTGDYSKTISTLDKNGFFKNAGFGGQGADEFGGITAKLSRSQQRNIAAGIESLAGKDAESITNFLKDPKNAGIIQDLKAVVQYPDRGFTSSNFMKALNLAVFPARYNLKVTALAAKALAKQPGAVQVQVLKGLKDFNDWQKTPEGIKWKSDNSELIGIVKYLTPIGSVESVLKALGGNFKDLGTIGGLPFGVISTVLEGQGIGIKALSTPYLDPKTGEVVPDKIPADDKARLKQAVADIINTMFTYPGRQIGGISKKEITDVAAKFATAGKFEGGKVNKVTRTDLTPEQRKMQTVLKAGGKTEKYKLPSKEKVPTIKMGAPTYNLSAAGTNQTVRFPKTGTTKSKRVKTKATRPGVFRP